MLVEITKVPNAENSAIHLHPTDNVAIARVPLPAGTELRVDGLPVLTRDAIPAGHKVALWDIAAGETVERYGQAIGSATVPIDAGRHVHTHNLAFEELVLDYEFPTTEILIPGPRADAPTFLGYAREDGRAGTRNYIAVVAASNCAAHTAELIARSYDGAELPPNVDGVVAFPHGEGCGHAFGPDMDQLRRTLGGVLVHPNVSAALIVGLGCEGNQIGHYLGPGVGANRLVGMTLQASGGTTGTLAAARREITRFSEQASAQQRVPRPAAPPCWARRPRSSAPSTCWSSARATAKSPTSYWGASGATRSIWRASKVPSTTTLRPATKRAASAIFSKRVSARWPRAAPAP